MSSADPSEHRSREEQFIGHVEKLLDDERLRLDTTRGRRPVTTLVREVKRGEKSVELTRLMSEMNLPDRELRDRMPVGRSLAVTLSKKQWWIFNKAVGRLCVQCVSPSRSLLSGEQGSPMSRGELTEVLRQAPEPSGDVPSTLVVMSTSGFAIEANELAERRSDRTVILASPNAAGGWNIVGPAQTKGLADLFDPEADAEKRRRVREAIETSRADLSGAGLASDHLAARTNLPASFVDSELKQYAKETPGLAAKRLDGKMVLFRLAAGVANGGGGVAMPLIDKMKALFARQGETEKKIAFLSERRAALSQQRDRGYEEMNALESREADLRKAFADSTGDISKRRITSQLLQVRKDLDRRQQLLSVLNQQVNVVATHLHNLELVRQGKTAQLPNSDEMAADAEAAEEMIADLQASGELADSVGSGIATGMTAEEQALYDELEKAGKAADPVAASEAAQAAPVKKPEPIRSAEPQQRKPESGKATPEAG